MMDRLEILRQMEWDVLCGFYLMELIDFAFKVVVIIGTARLMGVNI